MASLYHPRGTRPPPSRSIFAVFAAISVFIIGLLAVSQLGGSPWRRQAATPLDIRRVQQPGRSVAKTRAVPAGDEYLIGVGKADITGPVVEIDFAGVRVHLSSSILFLARVSKYLCTPYM